MLNPIELRTHLNAIGGIGQIAPRPEVPTLGPVAGAAQDSPEVEGPGFAQMLTDSIEKVNTQMTSADKKAEDLITGRSQDLQGTLVAMQKADISFRMLMEVRTKMMRAYEEIMRLQA